MKRYIVIQKFDSLSFCPIRNCGSEVRKNVPSSVPPSKSYRDRSSQGKTNNESHDPPVLQLSYDRVIVTRQLAIARLEGALPLAQKRPLRLERALPLRVLREASVLRCLTPN